MPDDRALADAQARLLRNRSQLPEHRARPRRVELGKYCVECGIAIDHIGVCESCAKEARAAFVDEKIGPVFASIPSAYDAKWGERKLIVRVPSLARHREGPGYFFQRRVLMLVGESGAGKSSLASALFRYAVKGFAAQDDHEALDIASRARWVEARDVPGDGFGVAWGASVLVVDDVGQEGGAGESFASQDRQRIMADLLDKLYTHRVFGQSRGHIILTTYGTPELWRKWYGAGVARRYWEDADHVLKVELER